MSTQSPIDEPSRTRSDVGGALDQGADVRVQHRHHAALGGVRGDPVEVADERLPLHVVEDRAGVVPLGAGGGREHDDPGVGGETGVDERVDLVQRVVVVVVQDDGEEAAHGLQAVAVEEGRLRGRLAGEEALGAELRGRQPEGPHVGEDPVG